MNSTAKKNFHNYNLLGDPEVPIWTASPGTLSVSHDSSVGTGNHTITVTVTSGAAVSGATVCFMKGTDGSEVYATGTTNASGQVSLSVSPSTLGTMYVTVTKHNYKPSETEITVANSPPSAFNLLTPNSTQTTRTPTIDWQDSTDPDSDPISYKLEIDDDSSFSSINITKTSLSSSQYTVALGDGLTENTTYYYRVIASDGNGGETASTQSYYSFTVNESNESPGTFKTRLVTRN